VLCEMSLPLRTPPTRADAGYLCVSGGGAGPLPGGHGRSVLPRVFSVVPTSAGWWWSAKTSSRRRTPLHAAGEHYGANARGRSWGGVARPEQDSMEVHRPGPAKTLHVCHAVTLQLCTALVTRSSRRACKQKHVAPRDVEIFLVSRCRFWDGSRVFDLVHSQVCSQFVVA